MKKWIFIILAIPVIVYVSYKGYRFIKHRVIKYEISKEYTDKTVPDAKGTDVNGNRYTLSSQKNKNTIIVFWATWCRYCVDEVPQIIEFQKNIDNNNIVIVSSTLDKDTKKAREFIKNKNINYKVIIGEENSGRNSEFNKPFKIVGIPSIWVINKEGKVIATNLRHFNDAVELLKDK